MKSITIQGKKRESVGKASSRALRNAEHVPCVLYGGAVPLHFSVDQKSFKGLIYTTEAYKVVIDLEGEQITSILQDAQFHPVTDKILHVDFYQLTESKEATMEIPVKLVGRAKGIVRGGKLVSYARKLKIRAFPEDLPDFIEINVTPLNIGGKVYVKALRNDKYKALHPDNMVVVAVKASRLSAKMGAVSDDDDDEGQQTESKQEANDNK